MSKTEEIDPDLVRACNRCNKLLDKCIGTEPRCGDCNCPEFRWESKYVYEAARYWYARDCSKKA